MRNRQHRMAIAWQNAGNIQPPHPSYFLGNRMEHPSAPNIITSVLPPTLSLPGDLTVEATSSAGAIVNFSASANEITCGKAPKYQIGANPLAEIFLEKETN